MLTKQQFQQRVFAAGVVPALEVASYGDEISAHIHAGPDMVWSPDTHEVAIFTKTLELYEEARAELGIPIQVDAGYRTIAHEDFLESKGYKTAKNVSPHSLCAALDLKLIGPGTSNQVLARALRNAAGRLGLPAPRIGHRAYAEVFCHVDLLFMLFEPHTSLAHPKDWPELDQATRDMYAHAWQPGVEW